MVRADIRRFSPGTLSLARPLVFGITLMLTACTNPESVSGFEEPDSAARMRAIRDAAQSDNRSAIPSLIERLNSSDPAERLLAIRALEKLTGTTNGFDHAASLTERTNGVERWRVWMLDQRAAVSSSGGPIR